jgi:tetratricopeptide (TPR) repeat protein
VKLYREVADQYAKDNFHLKSIAVYKTILKLVPTMMEINEKLGDLYRQVGLDNDAMHQYYIVASYFDNKGLVKEAMEVRRKIVDVDPANTTGRIRLAELMQADGKTEESIREYEKTAEILSARRDREGLIEVYEKMLYFRPDNVAMLIDLCRIYFDKKEVKKALRRIEASPEAVKKSVEVGEIWSEALLEDRQIDSSRRKFRETYGQALETKKAELAARVYSRILQEFNDDQDYLNELEELRKNFGGAPVATKPKFRQDFEKTDMIDLSKLDEMMKKK